MKVKWDGFSGSERGTELNQGRMFSGVGREEWFASVEDDGGHRHPNAKKEADGVHDGNESVAATCPEVRS